MLVVLKRKGKVHRYITAIALVLIEHAEGVGYQTASKQHLSGYYHLGPWEIRNIISECLTLQWQ